MVGNFPEDPDTLYVILPDKKDQFVYWGIAQMLYRLTYGGDGYCRIHSQLSSFYKSLNEIGKVDKVYKLDLNNSLNYIPISRILHIIKPLVGSSSVFNLISSFLYLPIIDNYGNNYYRSKFLTGIPPLGEITRVLFDLVLIEIFDRKLSKKYPGIRFVRFLHEVYVFTSGNDVIFDEKVGYALLEELGLKGKIESTGINDDPLVCYSYRILFLDINSMVRTLDINEYRP